MPGCDVEQLKRRNIPEELNVKRNIYVCIKAVGSYIKIFQPYELCGYFILPCFQHSKFYVWATQCASVSCVDFITNSDSLPVQRLPNGLFVFFLTEARGAVV